MKAAIRYQYCAFRDITVTELPKPVPKKDEVLIKVHATTVNRTDCAVVTGKPFVMRFFTGLFKPKKPITGTDFAGRVEAVGPNVTQFTIGDDV
jgi:NADPH:quinone reductase-like Zn-dependent oxidoreductase